MHSLTTRESVFLRSMEYQSTVVDGDTRVIVMNAVPMGHKKRYATFRRVRSGDDMRRNIHRIDLENL